MMGDPDWDYVPKYAFLRWLGRFVPGCGCLSLMILAVMAIGVMFG